MGASRNHRFPRAGRGGIARLAAWLAMAGLLAQLAASQLPMPQLVAGMPGVGMAAAADAADCTYDQEDAPKGVPHPHKQCAICLALQLAGTFIAPLPQMLADPSVVRGNPAGPSEIRAAAAAAFARPQPRAPPASASV